MPVVQSRVRRISWPVVLSFVGLCLLSAVWAAPALAAKAAKKGPSGTKASAAGIVAQRYAEAVAAGDRVAAGQLDFACQYRMVAASPKPLTAFPPPSDPMYAACWDQLLQAHGTAVEHRDRGMDVLWPGKGALVFFREELTRYPASAFVMDLLGTSPPAGGLQVQVIGSAPLPAGSFRLREDAPTVAAPATLVRTRVSYKDPLTSPVTFAPGTYKWTNTVKRPRRALKTVTLKWVVLSGLRKLGFPGNEAVVNLPVAGGIENAETGLVEPRVPFVTETGGYVGDSGLWWQAGDAPGLLIAAVGRAAQFPEQRDRVALLNRVLIIDPAQPDALTTLSRDLYQTLLTLGATTHKVVIADTALASRFDELYWDVYAQTSRVDISLGMEVGGFAKPTPADYLYRLIPAMERLAQVRPDDLENRLRLGAAYRWNNDQLAAIAVHEALVREIQPARQALRARALIELAWSRIAKVSWNRTFNDPGILEAYKDAEGALKLAENPLDKFAASYTMAYSLVFTPTRDNHAILDRLTEARRWYMQLAGASSASWRYLLSNDTLKGVIETDPAFQPLLSVS